MKTINGEKVPVLGKIDAPVKINGIVYQSKFHVIHIALLMKSYLGAISYKSTELS